MLRPLGLALSLSLLLSGCSTLSWWTGGTTPRPPVDVFDCVRTQIPVLGYAQASFDVETHRVTALKYDWETRLADSQFRRMVERLSIEIRESGDGGAELKIGARSFAEFVTQRGPTEIERRASPAARAAAQALLEACGS